MTIAVAHHTTSPSDEVLAVAGAEAKAHGSPLVVLNVVTSIDLDAQEALVQGISDLVESALADAGIEGVDHEVRIVAAASTGVDSVTTALLAAADDVGADMLVIGARRRSPVGKAFLGSVTQDLLLQADIPVLVVRVTGKG